MPAISFAGIASGLDTNALIDAQTRASRRTKVEPKTNKVNELEDANQGLSSIKTRLTDLQANLKKFNTLSGGGVAKQVLSSNEGTVAGTALNGTTSGTYSISSITSVAKNHVLSFNQTFSSTSSVINPSINDAASSAARSISVQVGSPTVETVDIPLTSTTTIDGFVSAFNTTSTLATASLVNVGSAATPSYKIFITSNKTGTAEGTLAVSNGAEVGTIGGSTNDSASNAVFTVSGLSGTITRSSNSVSNVIPGLTFEIFTTSASPISLTVGDDSSRTVSAVKEIVDGYNSLVQFIRDNDTVSRSESNGELQNVFGPLARTRTDNSVIESLRSDLASVGITGNGTSTINVLADLGITTSRDGTLEFNQATFISALATDSSATNRILQELGDITSTTGGTIDDFIKFNGILDISINANRSQTDSLNRQISNDESLIARQEEQMRLRFSRLEALMGRLQSQQSQVQSALSGLGR
jgi:flagellar hook-associated protein 2